MNPCDLILSHNGDGELSAGAWPLSSILLDKGMSPMMTMNGGGKKVTKVSDKLRDLAVPAGLLYLQHSQCLKLPHGDNKGIVDKSLYNRLLDLAAISVPQMKRITRSRRSSTKKGTRRHH